MIYQKRTSCPEVGNPYYNRKSSGGYNDAIKGSKDTPGLDVLPNCVGFAVGRFMEIQGTGAAAKHPCPVNAERFPDYLNGLKMGTSPKLGSIICWAKGSPNNSSDGCGHVAVVEEIYEDGSILTSESGWGSDKLFWTKIRKDDGNWGQPDTYKFLGFIYQPYEYEAPANNQKLSFDIIPVKKGMHGDFVKKVQIILKGLSYYNGKIDGLAGTQTHNAIINYQKASGGKLVVDGIFGIKTWEYFLN